MENAHAEIAENRTEFSDEDMLRYQLVGSDNASKRRSKLGDELGIGYCNAKQFLKRLNNYGIRREELECAIKKYLESEDI